MVLSGNHEQYGNFEAFNKRWSMPETGRENLFFSHDFGGIHMIYMSTEIQYHDFKPDSAQFRWLEFDLQRAVANRHNVPWIMFQGHRPLYDVYYAKPNELRIFIEPLLMKYKVDIALWAHYHCYLRSYPVYDGKPTETSGNVFRNPKAPIHLMVGNGGAYNPSSAAKICSEALSKHDYLAFEDQDFGFGRMNLMNSTHLNFQYIKTNERFKITDEMWIIKD
jgi:acid phosphatase type 7